MNGDKKKHRVRYARIMLTHSVIEQIEVICEEECYVCKRLDERCVWRKVKFFHRTRKHAGRSLFLASQMRQPIIA